MKQRKTKAIGKKALKKVKSRVKKALVTRRDVKDHRPTLMQIQLWFGLLNKGIFNSKLAVPIFSIQRLHNALGECECSWDGRKVKCKKNHIPVKQLPNPAIEFKIKLLPKYQTWKDFIETLAHEMVHLYQMTIDRDVYSNHNTNFYKWRYRFKQFGLRLCL